MTGPADIQRFPTNLASATSPGLVPNLGGANGAATLGGDGLHPSNQYRPATALAIGGMPATEMAKTSAVSLTQMQELGAGRLSSLSEGGWFDAQKNRLKALDPTLTGFTPYTRAYLAAVQPHLVAGSNPAQVEGGGLVIGNSGWIAYSGGTVCLRPDLNHWSFGWRGYMPATGTNTIIGLTDLGNRVGFAIQGSSTNLVIHSYKGGTTNSAQASFTPDSNPHTFTLDYNATTLTMSVDGDIVATLSDLSHVPSTACMIGSYCASGSLTILQMYFAFVEP